jgi:hypothetical protein
MTKKYDTCKKNILYNTKIAAKENKKKKELSP